MLAKLKVICHSNSNQQQKVTDLINLWPNFHQENQFTFHRKLDPKVFLLKDHLDYKDLFGCHNPRPYLNLV